MSIPVEICIQFILILAGILILHCFKIGICGYLHISALCISQGASSPKMDFRRAHLVDGQDLFLWLVPSFSDQNPLTVLKKKLALFFFGC